MRGEPGLVAASGEKVGALTMMSGGRGVGGDDARKEGMSGARTREERLRERDESWGVIDVKVEGVGLVANYKSQFKELLGNGTPEDLLARMREKNNEVVVDAPLAGTPAGS